MTSILVVVGILIIVVLAAAFWWRLTAPGKRIRVGAATLYYSPALIGDVVNRLGTCRGIV